MIKKDYGFLSVSFVFRGVTRLRRLLGDSRKKVKEIVLSAACFPQCKPTFIVKRDEEATINHSAMENTPFLVIGSSRTHTMSVVGCIL